MPRKQRSAFKSAFGLAAGWSCGTLVILAAAILTVIVLCGGGGSAIIYGIAKTRVEQSPAK